MIIDRYILKEILYTLLVVLFVLLVIFLSNRLIRFLAAASAGDLAGQFVLTMLAMKALEGLVVILPLGLFVAILLGLSRMYKDSEMVALSACGVSVRRIYRSVIALALVVAAIVGVIAFYVAPWAEEQSYRMRDAQDAPLEVVLTAVGGDPELAQRARDLVAVDVGRQLERGHDRRALVGIAEEVEPEGGDAGARGAGEQRVALEHVRQALLEDQVERDLEAPDQGHGRGEGGVG